MTLPKISLRSVLIGINLIVLVLPIAGIALMRLYESALVRQTESALIAQAAFVAAYYRAQARDQGTQNWLELSREVAHRAALSQEDGWLPQPPQLDLADSPVLPGFPAGRLHATADAFAQEVGNRLMPVLKDAQLVTLAGIRIVDPWGVIVASTGNDVGQSIAHSEEIASALKGIPTSRLRHKQETQAPAPLDSISRTTQIRVFVASPIVMHDRLVGAVMLNRTPPSIVQAFYAKRWLLAGAFGILVVLVLLMSWLTYRLIERPITRLARAAEQIASGDVAASKSLSNRLAAGGGQRKPRTREIARLQFAIADMANVLEQRANYLQDFARHVSHEFKTPIASIRGAIEVVQDHGDSMPAQQQEKFLTNIAADAQRLHRLTERLMELTKAELVNHPTTRFDLLEAIVEATADFTHTANFRLDRATSAPIVTIREVLLATLEILFENAIQHHASEITVWTEQGLDTEPASNAGATEAHKMTRIFVQDNGEGISVNNRETIFTPFFTTERHSGGTGLGLTIAQRLMQQANAAIELRDDNGPTTFILSIPS